jgi:hypothetical protein
MTPSHDNLTSSKTADMGDVAHPVSPRPSKHDAKKFTFDCISPDASIIISDSRDVPDSEAEKADAMEENKEELRDVPMETAAEATEDDKVAVVEEGAGSDDPNVTGLMVTLKLDDDEKTTQGTSGQEEAAPNLWYLCGMDPTDLMTLTTFEASMKYLATASVGVETTETQPNGEESEPFDDGPVTIMCQDHLETIEDGNTSEAKIDPVVAETLTAACNRLLLTVANCPDNLGRGNEESSPQLDASKAIDSHATEAVATAEPIAPLSIDTLRFVDYDIDMAPSDEMENKSAFVSPAANPKSPGFGDVCFNNLKVFQAYV